MKRNKIIVALSLIACTLLSCQNEKGCGEIAFGIYAASPVDHSFTAQFSEMKVEQCKWSAWSSEDTGFSQTKNESEGKK